jgi:hypothetical protein
MCLVLIFKIMKKLILTLAVTMLAARMFAPPLILPLPITLTIIDLGGNQFKVITKNVPLRVPYTYVEISTNLINWTPIVTNVNLNGSATNIFQTTNTMLFYTAVTPF